MKSDRVWHSVTVILSVCLLVSSILYLTKGTTPASGPYYLSVPTSTWTYLVSQFSNGSYYMVNGTNWHVDSVNANSATIIQYALDNVTVFGGTVYVSQGIYSASVTLKNNTRLVLEKGCVGVTVAVDALATCILEDYNLCIAWFYSSGVLVMQNNNLNGLITGIYSSFSQYWSLDLNRTDAVVNPISTASYIIDVSGSNYRMKNGTTGQFDFVSSNASAVINNALGNATKGTIFLKAGTYSLSTSLIPCSNVDLLGEKGAILQATTNLNDQIIEVTSIANCTISNLEIDGNQANQGGGSDYHGIRFIACDNIKVLNCYVHHCKGVGIDFSCTGGVGSTNIWVDKCTVVNCTYGIGVWGSVADGVGDTVTFSSNYIVNMTAAVSDGIMVKDTSNAWVINNKVFNVSDDSIEVQASSSNMTDVFVRDNVVFTSVNTAIYINMLNAGVGQAGSLKRVFVTGNSIRNAGTGHTVGAGCGIKIVNVTRSEFTHNIIENNYEHAIQLTAGSNNNTVSGNICRDSGNSGEWMDGIQVDTNSDFNRITDNWCGNTGELASGGCYRGIDIQTNTCDSNVVEDNTICNIIGEAIRNAGTGTTVRFNIGFVTESSGSTASCINGSWITHGLAATPSNVVLTINGSSYLNSSSTLMQPTIIAWNSTHFQIGFFIKNDRNNLLLGNYGNVSYFNTTGDGKQYMPWDTLNKITDGNYSTACDFANRTNGGAGESGAFAWDLGSIHQVELVAYVGINSTAGTESANWYWSNDNVTWNIVCNSACTSKTSVTEALLYTIPNYCIARYVQLKFSISAAGTASCRIYEAEAIDIGNTTYPVTASYAQTINWIANYIP